MESSQKVSEEIQYFVHLVNSGLHARCSGIRGNLSKSERLCMQVVHTEDKGM